MGGLETAEMNLYWNGKKLGVEHSLLYAGGGGGISNNAHIDLTMGNTGPPVPLKAPPPRPSAKARKTAKAKEARSAKGKAKVTQKWYGCWYFEGEEAHMTTTTHATSRRIVGEAVDEDRDTLAISGAIKQDDAGNPKWTFKMTMD